MSGGLLLASTTAYLRLAADRHYLTDTIAAAAAGSLIGVSIPYFLHRPQSDEVQEANIDLMILPQTNGTSVAIKWNW